MGDLYIALGRLALAGTSGYSLYHCSDLKIARLAFGLYFIDGTIGVIDYVLPKSNAKVKKALAFMDRISKPCYTPFIAAEAFIFAGFEDKWAYCHCVFPVCYVALTEFLKKNIQGDLVDLGVILNTASVCYSAYEKDDYAYGGFTGLFNIAAFLGANYNSLEFFFLLSFGNLAAVQFFKQAFSS